jgi:hypothetical protein
MQKSHKYFVFGLITAVITGTVFFMPPISQNNSFHAFADGRKIAGIPNFFNVITNVLFTIVGVIGLGVIRKAATPAPFQVLYTVLFLGILFTGIGSAYYHLAPANDRLVYDRLPMTIVFMSFFCVVVSYHMNRQAGEWLLIPLLCLGIGSVLWWKYTENTGSGDLRLYLFVQFYPVIIIPVILLLFPVRGNKHQLKLFLWIVIFYIIAKILEYFDAPIFHATNLFSGHSLKHVAAAVSTWYILKTLVRTDSSSSNRAKPAEFS